MSHDQSLIPSTPQAVILEPNLDSINRQAVNNIREIFSQEQVPRRVRRGLIRQEFEQLIKKRDVQLEASLRIEERRVAGIERVAVQQIKRQEEEFVLRIRSEFVEVLSTLGVGVRMNSLNCLNDFAMQITAFRAQVQNERSESEFKDFVLSTARDAFYSLAKQLGEIAGSEAERMMKGAD